MQNEPAYPPVLGPWRVERLTHYWSLSTGWWRLLRWRWNRHGCCWPTEWWAYA